jgi:hypothetical protein
MNIDPPVIKGKVHGLYDRIAVPPVRCEPLHMTGPEQMDGTPVLEKACIHAAKLDRRECSRMPH